MNPVSAREPFPAILLVQPPSVQRPAYRPFFHGISPGDFVADTGRSDGRRLFSQTPVRVGDGVYLYHGDPKNKNLLDFELDPQTTGEAATYFPPFIRVLLDGRYPGMTQLARKIKEALVSGPTYDRCEQQIPGMQVIYQSHDFNGLPAFQTVKIRVEQSDQAIDVVLSHRDRSAILGCYIPGDGVHKKVFGIDITLDSLKRPRYRLTWLADTFAHVLFGNQRHHFDAHNWTPDGVSYRADDPFYHRHHRRVGENLKGSRPRVEWGLSSQQIYMEPGVRYELYPANPERMDSDTDYPIVITLPEILPVPRLEV